MVTIKFSDSDERVRGLGFLLRNFAGRALKTGEVLVSNIAVEALSREGFHFTVVGESGYEQNLATFRDPITSSV